MDLCGTCGASWACEHRDDIAPPAELLKPNHVIYNADARGNVTTQHVDFNAAISAGNLPSPDYNCEELEERIAAIVQPVPRGLSVSDIMTRLNWYWSDQDRRRLVNNAIARLVRRKVLYKARNYASAGTIFPYTLETHRGEVRYMLHSIEDHELRWAQNELQHAQEKVDRLKRKRAALEKELAGLVD